jgi:Predicted hydrolase of the HD superfamily (permuted catalytic motifs)
MSRFNEYFDESFGWLQTTFKTVDISSLLKDDMYIIAGDFYGIQQFIFNDLQSKSAAKVLRAKSAYVQIFTQFAANYVCHIFGIEQKYIISISAGKFEILLDKFDVEKFNQVKKDIEEYFIKNFCASSGISLVYATCCKNDFQDKTAYTNLREKMSNLFEYAKFKKFDIPNLDAVILKQKVDINFASLGSKLVADGVQTYKSNELGIELNGFVCDIVLDERIKSYVFKDGFEIVDFNTLAQNSIGAEAIAVLKADVDNMGTFIRDSNITHSFNNFDLFSKSLDSFFSIYIPRIMKEKFSHTYTIFAGGDDLLLIGAWNEVLELARFIETDFKKFIKNNGLSISFGIALAKPSTPIGYLANFCEELLEMSKNFKENEGIKVKDAITIFGETARWSSYKKVFKNVNDELEKLNLSDVNMAFLYRLLELCNMRKNIVNDLRNALWRSKLVYSISRNLPDAPESLICVLNDNIENNPEETKMSICEFIYKRRSR